MQSAAVELSFTILFYKKIHLFVYLISYALLGWFYIFFQDQDFGSADDIFSHTGDKRAPLKPPVRKALAVFSGKRNPNDNHFSRRKH